ncbi:second BRCT domain on nijmegen syndrome breakage protein [Hirsutella rhossiliensis]|uniref:Second BRCT domain on nijmegen syndrome breakage protein n=1 Tax=Hirsutella rhossiliensis TaxID=111463 RepID=A0A9P8MXP8_9HYPO|nr:second BRCT domain on nijmegen syndrome breakage protein [Hirsutella rhossiliensis]KAH0962201.1 second BRCT domain on nijmegen syndrome breakage protein [Hirsutella rhossiliensis]
MWLLENEEIFQGRQLWLRPGKTYLFGRTAAEPGQLAVSHNTISRKHLTITVDNVVADHARRLSSRSRLTIEDLATKIGTVVNGQKIKGSKYVVDGPEVEMTMGKCPSKFYIKWFPVVLTFSFTNKELQTEPLTSLQERFENLDIKLSTDYHIGHTTHVVSKKRNTAKGLQALINGKFVVTETFLDAIAQAAGPPGAADGAEPSPLEDHFSLSWPDPMKHLPPRGGEPVQHPDEIYAPDLNRKDVFDGYTFIFYDKTQYNNLLAPITNGYGKAMLHTITPGEELVEDFVRYVKEVAGEKGLGRFEDGSEGKGVVLVRYLPGKGDLVGWYTNFLTAVSLRLDHRPIEQNEFLEAILTNDASKLRRPLEVESQSVSGPPMTGSAANEAARTDPGPNEGEAPHPQEEPQDDLEQQPAIKRGTKRRPVKRRFAGFDDDVDVDMDEPPPAELPEPEHPSQQAMDAGLSRRRAASLLEDDLMQGMAPAVARFKRQRLEHAGAFASPSPGAASPSPSVAAKAQTKRKAKEIDVLAMAALHREEEEARARAEREDLAQLPADVDLAEIRRLNIVEEMEVRTPGGAARTREQDIADGRWDPKWNGVKNFKKFRRRGEAAGRQPARVIVPLTQVKNKEFGVGDNYWLEDEGSARIKSAPSRPPDQDTPVEAPPPPPPASRTRSTALVVSDSSDAEASGADADGAAASSRRIGTGSRGVSATQSRRGGTVSQSSRQTSQGRGKRAAPEPAPEPRGKRPRTAPRRTEMTDSDDSGDELKFRFGRRR